VIGRELTAALAAMNHNIYLAGRTKSADFPNLKWLPWTLGQKMDLTNLPSMDVVIHLAWQTNSRREKFHLNVGGSLQMLNEFEGKTSQIIFLSSLAALNPKSYYGLGKSTVEEYCASKGIEVIRSGLILGGERYSGRMRRTKFIPGGKTTVYITHLECLVSEITKSVSNLTKSSYNLVCEEVNLSKLVSKNSRYIPIPKWLTLVALKAGSFSMQIDDLKDAYISLITTPKIESKHFVHKKS
jgi:hypothetical protein